MMPATDKTNADPSNANILLVDDDALLRRSTARLLRQAGHRVDEQPDGEAALQALSKGNYDVVLTDLSMPRLDGLELLRRIRSFDSELPVILVTGAPDLGSAVEAVELGATRYLTKPFRHEALKE